MDSGRCARVRASPDRGSIPSRVPIRLHACRLFPTPSPNKSSTNLLLRRLRRFVETKSGHREPAPLQGLHSPIGGSWAAPIPGFQLANDDRPPRREACPVHRAWSACSNRVTVAFMTRIYLITPHRGRRIRLPLIPNTLPPFTQARTKAPTSPSTRCDVESDQRRSARCDGRVLDCGDKDGNVYAATPYGVFKLEGK